MSQQNDIMTNGQSFAGISPIEEDEPTPEWVTQLKADNHCEEVIACKAYGKRYWFRTLKVSEFNYAQDLIFNKKKLLEAMTYAVRQCCLHPSKTELNALISQYPGIVMTMGNSVWEASGTIEAEVKKY
jgi:hypothetical protein